MDHTVASLLVKFYDFWFFAVGIPGAFLKYFVTGADGAGIQAVRHF